MQPPRSTLIKMVLGFGTHLPLLGCILLAYNLFGVPEQEWLSGSSAAVLWFTITWSVMFVGGVIAGAIAIYYLFIVFRSDASESDRQFWLRLLVVMLPVAGPIFWYRVIWQGQSVSVATKKA